MDIPVVKKRTRIKINLTLSPENLDLQSDTLQIGSDGDQSIEASKSEKLETLSEPKKEEMIELPKPAPRKSIKPMEKIEEPAEVMADPKLIDLQSDIETKEIENDEAQNSDTARPKSNETQHSNTTKPIADETQHTDEKIDEVLESKSLPAILSPKADNKIIGKKKKRKAADVLASVLRKESKQFPKVATILQESEEKDKDECDVGSPWDSPPPPKSLEKVYIQHKYGFSVRDWCDFYSKPDVTKEDIGNRWAVDVALSFHGLWSRLSIFSHGLVAGIAGCHALAVAAALAVTQSDVPQFVNFYHFLSLKIHFLIYVFTTLCVISCFDRLDIGQSRGHLKDVGRSHGTLLLTFTYLLCLGLSLAAHRHTAAIEAYSSDNTLWNPQGLHEWTSLVTIRDILLLLCWIFMSCSTPSDYLKEKLVAMTNRQKSGKATLWKLPAP